MRLVVAQSVGTEAGRYVTHIVLLIEVIAMNREKPKTLRVVRFIPSIVLLALSIVSLLSWQNSYDYFKHFYEHFDVLFRVDVTNIDTSYADKVILTCDSMKGVYDFEMSKKKFLELAYTPRYADIILQDNKPYKIIPKNSEIYYDPLMPIHSSYWDKTNFLFALSLSFAIYAVIALVMAIKPPTLDDGVED